MSRPGRISVPVFGKNNKVPTKQEMREAQEDLDREAVQERLEADRKAISALPVEQSASLQDDPRETTPCL